MSDSKIVTVGRVIGATPDQFKGAVKGNMLPAFDLNDEKVISSTSPEGLKIKSNVLDPNTGELATFIEDMSDPNVDGVVYLEHEGSKYKRAFKEGLNSLWYNIKADGDTDDTIALQKAIDQSLTDDVILPKGTIVFSSITLRDGMNIRGLGKGTVLKSNSKTSGYGITMGENSSIRNISMDGGWLETETPSSGDSVNRPILANNKKKIIIENCRIYGWGGGVLVTDCYDVIIKNNFFFANASHQSLSDIGVSSSTSGGRVIIEGNYCMSNNSQAIGVGTLGSDSLLKVVNNYCVAMKANGSLWIEGAGLRRRHGILMGYNGGIRTHVICTGNHCVNTRWTGIYLQGDNNITGGDIIANNICIDNGWQQGEPLSGGIFVVNAGIGGIVSNNLVLNYRNATSAGAIRYSSSEPNESLNLTGNIIAESYGIGMSIGFSTNGANINNNYFINNVGRDISVGVASDTVNGKHIISDNKFKRNNNDFPSVYIDQGAQTGKYHILKNFFYGNSKSETATISSLGNAGNIAISVRNFENTTIKDNFIENYYGAVNFSENIPTSLARENMKVICDNNELSNCTHGICVQSFDANAIFPVEGNIFRGVTNELSASLSLGGSSTKALIVTRIGGNFIFQQNSTPPTSGLWKVGDRVNYLNIASNGANSAICTEAGTPGTWVEFPLAVKTDSIVSSTNNTLTATAKDRYRRYTGSAGLTTINENIHSAGDEHYGEVEGGERTFNAGSGVIIRVAEGFLPIVKSGGKYSLKFKSSTDVLLSGDLVKEKIEASPNSATDPGATYSQVESQAILDELRDLKLK